VIIVEARHRAGGRVHTARLWPHDPSSAPPGCTGVGELGGSVLTGTDGNPLAVVARQLGAQLHAIRDKCVLQGCLAALCAHMCTWRAFVMTCCRLASGAPSMRWMARQCRRTWI
jgi:hypothetical protein